LSHAVFFACCLSAFASAALAFGPPASADPPTTARPYNNDIRRCETVYASLSPSREWIHLVTRQNGFIKPVQDVLNPTPEEVSGETRFRVETESTNRRTVVGRDPFPYGFVSHGGFWSGDTVWNAYLAESQERLQYNVLTGLTTRTPINAPRLNDNWQPVGPTLGFNNRHYSAILFVKGSEKRRGKHQRYMVRIVDYRHNHTLDTELELTSLYSSKKTKAYTPVVIFPQEHGGVFIVQVVSYDLSDEGGKRDPEIHFFVLEDRVWTKLTAVKNGTHTTKNAKILEFGDKIQLYFQTQDADGIIRSYLAPIDGPDEKLTVFEGNVSFGADNNGAVLWRKSTDLLENMTYAPFNEMGRQLLQLLLSENTDAIVPISLNASGDGFVFRVNEITKDRRLELVKLRQKSVLTLPGKAYNNCFPGRKF